MNQTSLSGQVGPRFRWLADRHFDGFLGPEESRELSVMLVRESACARDFARRAMFHQQIRDVLRLERELDAPGRPRDQSSAWARRVAGLLVAVAAGAALLVGALTFGVRPMIEAAGPGKGDDPVARLSRAIDAVWSDPNVGFMLRHGGLPAGPLRLVSGHVEMVFASGGMAIVEGPATFEPLAGDALRVLDGSVRCRCPAKGTELRVETPSGTITDLGTEFAVRVEPGRRTRVAVIEGRVRLDAAEVSKLIGAGEAVSVGLNGDTSEDIGFLRDVAERTTLVPPERDKLATAPNLLADASFEDVALLPVDALTAAAKPQAGVWEVSAGHAETVSMPCHDGEQAIRIRAMGNPYWPLVSQEVRTGDIAGRHVLASVRASPMPGDPLVGRQCAIVKVVFISADGREFAQAERYFLRPGGTAGGFVEAGIAAVAPPGTIALRWQVLLNACGKESGSLVVDAARLAVARP